MRSLHRGPSLAVALSLMLLAVSLLGLGMAIQHGYITPPDVDVSVSGLHVVAYVASPITCGSYGRCPSPPRRYFVVWLLRKTAPNYLNVEGDRILMMPLQP